MQWPILPTGERTQSNTYMPLICSVIDGFEVVFPEDYEGLFNRSIGKYKSLGFASAFGKLKFKDFKTFRTFLQERVKAEIGSLSREDFFSACDSRKHYHIVPSRQTAIIGGDQLESFFGIFINDLMTNLGSMGLTCTLDPTGRAHRGEADRGEADRGEAHRGEAHRGEADRGEAHRGEPRWYFINDAGEDQPYSDDDNRKIKNGQKYGFNPVVLGPYTIDLNEGFQINTKTRKMRPIVLKGGRKKRTRRIIKKRT